MMKKNQYDAIIIGGGMGGLVTAALLSIKKKKVVLFEKNNKVGGFCVNFKRNNIDFDASLHLISGYEKDNLLYQIDKLSKINHGKVKFVSPKFLFRSIFPDFDYRVPHNDLPQHIKYLREVFPKYEKNINELINEMSEIYKDINNIDKNGLLGKAQTLTKYLNENYSDFLNRYFKDNALRSFLSQLWTYCGLPPKELSTVYYAYCWFDYMSKRAVYPEGGSQKLSDFLKSIILDNSGEINLDCEIKEIFLDDLSRAEGVATIHNEKFYAKNIISCIDIRKTFFHLLKQYKNIKNISNFKDKINLNKPSLSAFQVYATLDGDLPEDIYDDYEIFINPSYSPEEQYCSCLDNKVKGSQIVVTLYSNLDRKSAEFGKSKFSVFMLSSYEYWNKLTKKDYLKMKKITADQIIEKVTDTLPTINKNKIKIIDVATPLTMERYTQNYKGAIYGFARYNFGGSLRFIGTVSPIRNLFLVSGWTRIGGGIKGIIRAAQRIEKSIES